ncbi:MAG: hypothetical protein ACP5SH_23740 [Syntrophobacteraceae bacterium]
MGNKKKILRQAGIVLVLMLISGCMPSHVQPVSEYGAGMFPPQAVMQTGDYKGFVAENSAVLKACKNPEQCAGALFNLSFVYAYPKSPYYNPSRALQYISDLVVGAPKSPWAAEALVWRELIVREMKAANRNRWLLQKRLKSQKADIEKNAAKKRDWQVDRQLLEDEIKSKDQIIDQLTKQIKGSQKIDLEMQKKERELLH